MTVEAEVIKSGDTRAVANFDIRHAPYFFSEFLATLAGTETGQIHGRSCGLKFSQTGYGKWRIEGLEAVASKYVLAKKVTGLKYETGYSAGTMEGYDALHIILAGVVALDSYAGIYFTEKNGKRTRKKAQSVADEVWPTLDGVPMGLATGVRDVLEEREKNKILGAIDNSTLKIAIDDFFSGEDNQLPRFCIGIRHGHAHGLLPSLKNLHEHAFDLRDFLLKGIETHAGSVAGSVPAASA